MRSGRSADSRGEHQWHFGLIFETKLSPPRKQICILGFWGVFVDKTRRSFRRSIWLPVIIYVCQGRGSVLNVSPWYEFFVGSVPMIWVRWGSRPWYCNKKYSTMNLQQKWWPTMILQKKKITDHDFATKVLIDHDFATRSADRPWFCNKKDNRPWFCNKSDNRPWICNKSADRPWFCNKKCWSTTILQQER